VASTSASGPATPKRKSRIVKTIIPLAIFGVLAVSNPGTGIRLDVVPGHNSLTVPTSAVEMIGAEPAKVHFIDVGQGDSIYIQLPNRQDILIDAGDEYHGPAVVEYLRRQGMDGELELLIATHPHRDHIGGIPEVMANFQVDQVLDSGLTADSEWYASYSAGIYAQQCPWVCDDHQSFDFGEARLQILTGRETWENVNDYSVTARLDCGEIGFIFPGDTEADAETALPGDIRADILKVGHHGSETSTGAEFLARAKPEVGVISVGAGNQYGHPDGQILNRLQASGINVYRTDREGSVVISTDGKGYEVLAPEAISALP